MVILQNQVLGIPAVADNAVQEPEAETHNLLIYFVFIYDIQTMGISRHRAEWFEKK
jgi:hypothetical protein